MPSTPAIALSGLNAAQTQLDTAAHNIANLATPNFRRQQVQQATQPERAGVTTSLAQAEVEGAAIETDMVGLLQAKNAFLANLAVFKTHDQMTGALLKIKG
jgi:flagellar hook protein FlgE